MVDTISKPPNPIPDSMIVCIEAFQGRRSILLPLFEQADDSLTQIHSYIELGEVLVARGAGEIIGHIQLVAGHEWEIRSVAVVAEERGRGVGRALVAAAIDRALSAGAIRVLIATATADVENLRFYQRLGFRMERVEQDAFTQDRGYPNLTINGVPLRDRVWLSVDAKCRTEYRQKPAGKGPNSLR
jgi:GNAT superfamily N-acetyltransferase